MPRPVVPEEKRRRCRPTRSGTVLTERLIVGTALRLLREHGSAGLTARRLGRSSWPAVPASQTSCTARRGSAFGPRAAVAGGGLLVVALMLTLATTAPSLRRYRICPG